MHCQVFIDTTTLFSLGKRNIIFCYLQFDNFVEKTLTCTGERWYLVTDGQFPLRHYLHLEASRKKAKLSQHFYSFYDLRKEVRKAVKHDSDFKNLEEVASCILILAVIKHIFNKRIFAVYSFVSEPYKYKFKILILLNRSGISFSLSVLRICW